jgi:hypothetical protein
LIFTIVVTLAVVETDALRSGIVTLTATASLADTDIDTRVAVAEMQLEVVTQNSTPMAAGSVGYPAVVTGTPLGAVLNLSLLTVKTT